MRYEVALVASCLLVVGVTVGIGAVGGVASHERGVPHGVSGVADHGPSSTRHLASGTGTGADGSTPAHSHSSLQPHVPSYSGLQPSRTDCPATAPTGIAGADAVFDTDSGSDAAAATGAGAGPSADEAEPRIVSLVPNTARPGNAGEYLVLEIPAETDLENLTVTDGYATATLPDDRRTGRIAISADPEATRELTRHPVVEFDGNLRLAADGDELVVRRGGDPVDAVAYDGAGESEVWYRDADDRAWSGVESAGAASPADPAAGRWWPRGATCLPVTTTGPARATAFVLPDSPDVVRETVDDAESRLLVAGYTFTSEPIADALRDAADRGVRVDLLIEASPVGGTPVRTRSVLDDLADAGVTVRAIGGEGSRYAYHHPKYAVVDDRALVTTENWKPSGVGGTSSRGWGVRVADAELADALAAVFAADVDGRDVESWADYRETATFVEDDGSDGEPSWADDAEAGGDGTASASNDPDRYPSKIDPDRFEAESVELVVAPDNAEGRLVELLRSAEESILVKQARIGRDPAPLGALVDAARRGVEVRILLDASWYVEDDNEELATRLEEAAADEDLPLEVRLVEPGDRFEKIHAKGVVIDEEVAMVGSLNWNENALRENREVALVLHGDAVGAYYADVFRSDWDGYGDGGPLSLPLGLAIVVLAAVAAAAVAGSRYVEFERPEIADGPPSAGQTGGGDRPTSAGLTRCDDGFPAPEGDVGVGGGGEWAESPVDGGPPDVARDLVDGGPAEGAAAGESVGDTAGDATDVDTTKRGPGNGSNERE